MTDDNSSEAETTRPPGDVAIDLMHLAAAARGPHERRRKLSTYARMDPSDLLDAARQRGLRIRLHQCGPPKPAPRSVVTCARRVLQLALEALAPPTSRQVDIHLCGIVGQIGIQLTATERHSHARLVASESGRRALEDVSLWLAAFSPLFSVEPLRRDRVNIAAVLPFDASSPWALPKCSALHVGATTSHRQG
jgi:hypothetical protein